MAPEDQTSDDARLLQRRLIEGLGASADVTRVDADSFQINRLGAAAFERPVRLWAPPDLLREYASRHRADALIALGPVGGDENGWLAAVALLSVHVEEELAAARPGKSPIRSIRLTTDGLRLEREDDPV